MRGDLLFYRANPRSLVERFIAHITCGPFSHVAVDCGDGTIIEAQASGVKQVTPSGADVMRMVHFSPPPSSPAAESVAFGWLQKKVGAHYGWLDILDSALHLMHMAIYLGRPNEFDCSDLAACFAALWTNDSHLMNLVLDARQDISPNDLARYYRLVP